MRRPPVVLLWVSGLVLRLRPNLHNLDHCRRRVAGKYSGHFRQLWPCKRSRDRSGGQRLYRQQPIPSRAPVGRQNEHPDFSCRKRNGWFQRRQWPSHPRQLNLASQFFGPAGLAVDSATFTLRTRVISGFARFQMG